MKVLVVGSSGYVGSNLVCYLRHEHKVVGIDRRKSYFTDYVMDFRFVPIDLFEKFDCVIVCAADSFVPTCRDVDNNVGIALKLHELQIAYPLKRFIYFSTDEILSKCNHPYAESKIRAEEILKDDHVLILRPCNLYGEPYNAQVNPCIIPLSFKSPTLYQHGDGKQTRRFMNIEELLEDIAMYMESEETGITSYKDGVEISVHDLLVMISELTGKPINVVPDPRGEKQDLNFNYPDSKQTTAEELEEFKKDLKRCYLDSK